MLRAKTQSPKVENGNKASMRARLIATASCL